MATKLDSNINIKDHSDIIRATIREINHEDENYRWFVKSINKNHAMFGWSYITETCESPDDLFVIHAHEYSDGQQYAVINLPGASPVDYILKTVGDSRWDDACTLGAAIRMAIRTAAIRARNLW